MGGVPKQHRTDRLSAAVNKPSHPEAFTQHVRENDDDLIYLAALDRAEDSLASTLADLHNAAHPCPEIDREKAIQWIGQKVGLQLASQQQEAIRIAVKSKVLVITGGPGVGKTTLVNAIVKILRAKKLEVVLAAPTGRAAKRMMEATWSARPSPTVWALTGSTISRCSGPCSADCWGVVTSILFYRQISIPKDPR